MGLELPCSCRVAEVASIRRSIVKSAFRSSAFMCESITLFNNNTRTAQEEELVSELIDLFRNKCVSRDEDGPVQRSVCMAVPCLCNVFGQSYRVHDTNQL